MKDESKCKGSSMIDFKKFKFGRKKEQDDTASPDNSEMPVQPVHFVEQDVVELDLDDQTSSNDDVLARLGFTNDNKNNAPNTPSPEDNLQFPTIPVTPQTPQKEPLAPLSTGFSSSSTGSPSAVQQLNAAARAEKNALDALQEERKRNLERLRASIIQSTTASLELPKDNKDDFFKTPEESQLEQAQAERKRDFEELRANIAQSTFDLNRINTDTPAEPAKPRSLDEEFLQFKQAEHRARQLGDRQYATDSDQRFDKLKGQSNEGKAFSSLDEEFAKFRGIPESSLQDNNFHDDADSFSQSAQPAKKKRMISMIIGLGLLAGALVAVKYFVLDKTDEKLPDVVITPTTPAPNEQIETPPVGEIPPSNGEATTIVDGTAPQEAQPITPAQPDVPSTAVPPATTVPAPTAPVINTTPSKVLVDDSLLKQPVASDPTLIEEELAKLNELEKQLMEQQANLEAQHQDAEKLIKLKEERIRLLEAQLENKMRNQQQ